jgi:ribosomal protein L37E|tara:strand:+ start:331 stop:675 length:345 start_codon:yes stop_codon:yes gene_type:complete
MAHIFCQSCGTKISYANAKPNFCTKCGQPLNSKASTVSTNTSVTETVKSSVISSDETDAEFVPEITDFQVDFEVSNISSRTLGSLIGEPTPNPTSRRREPKSVNDFIDEKKKGK